MFRFVKWFLLLAMVFPPPSFLVDTGEETNLSQSDEADLFEEEYGGPDETLDEEVLEETMEEEANGLTITKEHAASNYLRAGVPVSEPEAEIKYEDFARILDPRVEHELEAVLADDVDLPYALADFQRIGVVALAGGQNLVMVIGTGEGKMTVPLLASLVIRRTKNKPKGVTIITQPLTGLMLEQLDNPVCPVAILSMYGELSTAEGKLSCEMEDILEGKYSAVIGHPESFATPLGRRLLTSLQRSNNLVMVVIDEFHVNSHWEAFRPEMMRLSTGLRAYASRGSPILFYSI